MARDERRQALIAGAYSTTDFASIGQAIQAVDAVIVPQMRSALSAAALTSNELATRSPDGADAELSGWCRERSAVDEHWHDASQVPAASPRTPVAA